MNNETLKLGSKVKDKITGFTGIITGKAEYLTGCNQYVVQPQCSKDNKGSYPEAQWFDEGRLTFIAKSMNKEDVKADENGSDYVAPIK